MVRSLLRDHACKGRSDLELRELDTRRLDGGRCAIDIGAQRVAGSSTGRMRALERVQQVLGHDRLFGELPLSLELAEGAVALDAGLSSGGLRDAESLLSETDLGPGRRIVEAYEQLSCLYAVALAVRVMEASRRRGHASCTAACALELLRRSARRVFDEATGSHFSVVEPAAVYRLIHSE